MDSGFVVLVFTQGDDLIACLNKAMAFLTVVASSRLPLTNNQLRTSSNSRNKATIQDGRVTVQQVQGRQGQIYGGTSYKGNATSFGGNNAGGQRRVVKCYNCQGEGHMDRQCTQPKRPRYATWFKEKEMLVKAQEDIQCAGSDTRPPMLDKADFASWQQRIRLYCRGTEGSLNLGPERPRVYSDLSQDEKDRTKGENHVTDYYVGLSIARINDMRNIKMTMSKIQLNSKFVNNMLPEWGRFVTAVKLNKGLKDSTLMSTYSALPEATRGKCHRT
ncbi:retrovirus-related pol polyprotein from transposon TNT 1-94 [Tanacetum coccineum]|uniref:Retrovirus-related pol polyprotein from transposon TNT 1-94 n=1 Tax=Tanacetum coccineum TaxID=301880 RepID=A0ABQ5HW20_9ASTR